MTSGDKSMALDQSPENWCTRIRGRLMRGCGDLSRDRHLAALCWL